MKSLLLILLLASTALADCRPWEIQIGSDILKGCGDDWKLYKARNLRITFPDGFTADRQPDGHGSCGQSTSCDALSGLVYALEGRTECWPQFDTPRSEEGLWSQTVHNQLAVHQLRECRPNFVAGPIICVEHPTVLARTTTVPHTCPEPVTIGGQPEWFNPFYTEPVCSWSYLPGLPYCGDFEPVNK